MFCKSLKLVDFLLGGVRGDVEAVAAFPTRGCQWKQLRINCKSLEVLSFSVSMGSKKLSFLQGFVCSFVSAHQMGRWS